jgi:ATP-binding cassette, subfamily B, bacterial
MLKKYKNIMPYLLLALVTVAAYSILEGVVMRNMMGLLDYALAGEMELLTNKAPILLFMAALLVPLGILVAMAGSFYKRKASTILKTYYITKVFGKNIAEFQKENNAKYLSAITNDFNTLEQNLINGILIVANGLAKFLVGVWILSTVDPRMILLAVAVIVVQIFLSMVTSKPTNKANKERSDLFDGYTTYIKEVLSAFHIVKNYNLQNKVTKDYYHKSEEIQQKGFLIERMLSFIFASQNFVTSISLYGIICGVGFLVVIGKITVGGLMLVVDGVQRMMWPLLEISESLPKLFTSKALIEKIEATLKNMDTHVETIDLPVFQEEIAFQNVEFHYADDETQQILSDVNFTVKKNGKYLIVGPSGGGKSTLLKLFRKYFKPTAGNILIDGKPLWDVKREQYFKLIANIEQQVFLFEDTLKNNITLYKEYSEEEILSAIQASGLSDFLERKEEGLDFMIYDNGRNISGGERSRIVIARALLNKASIIFMDEAFASLDMERAREIEKTILKLEDITVINVSHVIFQDTKDLYDRVITVKKTIF